MLLISESPHAVATRVAPVSAATSVSESGAALSENEGPVMRGELPVRGARGSAFYSPGQAAIGA
jgi:hypothetical protein